MASMAASIGMTNTLEQKISFVLRGYAPAVQCFLLIRDILHFWDDLIDRDKKVDQESIHNAMFKALVTLPRNEFYRKNIDTLLPVLVNAIANWRAANEFECTDDRKTLEIAFVIRSDYANILIQMAYIIGGHDCLMQVTPMIRSLWTEEDFEAYLKNLEQERHARMLGVPNVL